jgi:hypothetical protein
MFIGIASPLKVSITVAANATIADCRTIQSAVIKARSPTGTVHSWTASIAAQTVSACTVYHVFATAGTDVTERGGWVLVVECTTSAGTIPCTPVKSTATDYYVE